MGKYKLLIEYDGTRFRGWQKQGEKEVRTVQGTLQAAAEDIFGGLQVDIQGNGRTDAGVHAISYAAHLEVDAIVSPARLKERFNDLLPVDIVVLDAYEAEPRFHARHSCVGRSYLYRLVDRKSVFERRYAWCLPDELDVDRMGLAAACFCGMHDYAAFAERQELKKSTKVLVRAVTVQRRERRVEVRVVGSHFLWHMVRRMVGVLTEVGSGRMEPEAVRSFLSGIQTDTRRFTAPAHGLFFEEAFYSEAELAAFLGEKKDL